MAAFVLGNGVSRREVNVDSLMRKGTVYGCNALYRTHQPHVLVATDRPIANEIQESGYSQQHVFYTRRPLPDSGARTVPTPYFGYSSGPIAVSLAAAENHHPIYLLGFDMGPDTDGKFNNVYASTKHYKPHGATPTFTGNWARQLRKIMQDFHQCQFVRVVGATTTIISDLDGLKNLAHLPISEFLERINTGKEL